MYKRILLKISGEALAGEKKTGINSEAVGEICDRIKKTWYIYIIGYLQYFVNVFSKILY